MRSTPTNKLMLTAIAIIERSAVVRRLARDRHASINVVIGYFLKKYEQFHEYPIGDQSLRQAIDRD